MVTHAVFAGESRQGLRKAGLQLRIYPGVTTQRAQALLVLNPLVIAVYDILEHFQRQLFTGAFHAVGISVFQQAAITAIHGVVVTITGIHHVVGFTEDFLHVFGTAEQLVQITCAARNRIIKNDKVPALIGFANRLTLISHSQMVHLAPEPPLQAKLQGRHKRIHLFLSATGRQPRQQNSQGLG